MSASRSHTGRPVRQAVANRATYQEESTSDTERDAEVPPDRADSPYRDSPSPTPTSHRRGGRPPKQDARFGSSATRSPLKRYESSATQSRGGTTREPTYTLLGPHTKAYKLPSTWYTGWQADYDMPAEAPSSFASMENYITRCDAITASEAPPYFKAMAHFRLGEKFDEQDGVDGKRTAIEARRCYERANYYLVVAGKENREAGNSARNWNADARWEGRLHRYIQSASRSNWERLRVAMLEAGLTKRPMVNYELNVALLVDQATGKNRCPFSAAKT